MNTSPFAPLEAPAGAAAMSLPAHVPVKASPIVCDRVSNPLVTVNVTSSDAESASATVIALPFAALNTTSVSSVPPTVVSAAVTDGGMTTEMELSVEVDAVLPLSAASTTALAATEAITVPACVIPDTASSKIVSSSGLGCIITTVVAPAVPDRVTSPATKPAGGSLNVTVK